MKVSALLSLCLVSSLLSFSQADTGTNFVKGRNEYLQENYSQALKLFAQAQTEEPGNAQVPYLMAHVYSDMNNYKQAAVYFEKAIAIDSTSANWIYECGLTYYSIPDYKKSLQFIELAAEKGYKRTSDYKENLANALVNTKQYDRAIDIYKEILERKPTDQDVWYQLGQAYFNAAKFQDAIGAWGQLLNIDTTNAEALYMTGLSYQKKGEVEKGRQLCDKAIVWDPSLASKKKTMGGDL